jgi:hypothetical protein
LHEYLLAQLTLQGAVSFILVTTFCCDSAVRHRVLSLRGGVLST